ncbi:DNA-binding transcriptional LysR family regulator [Natronospira proteinivora]|uniref:DNA-binding transcriptional LysR family regulator n=1 Tax=Natronospira proteinivora TaxID=1807133 RepID=A0ABT1G9E8_9GAMM|nr:LysR family transcriptional regulator [Natronospira proteinivora]MCP1726577.1 DNA-binding transcriptional LysR family regulator [Natronospira proteinivora]
MSIASAFSPESRWSEQSIRFFYCYNPPIWNIIVSMKKQSKQIRPLASDGAVFCQVVERGSFTAAADALDLSKGAVSKYIGRLESRLGVRLLHRTTRRLALTEAGDAYYKRASRALAELLEAEQEVTEHADRPRGHLRISAPTFYGAEILSRHLEEFRRRYPDISLDLILDNRLVDLVEERFDAVIRLSAPRDSSLVMRKLKDIPIVTCASPTYISRHGRPSSQEALNEHECLVYTGSPRAHDWTYIDNDGNRYAVRVNGSIQSNDDHLLRQAALDGLGILRMPRLFLEEAILRGDLIPLWTDDSAPGAMLTVLYPSRRDLPAKVQAFVKFMIDIS